MVGAETQDYEYETVQRKSNVANLSRIENTNNFEKLKNISEIG